MAYTKVCGRLRRLPDIQGRGVALSFADSHLQWPHQTQENVMIRRRNAWPQVFSAFAIGLGAGAALGLLFAPQSGEDTRGLLRSGAQEGIGEAVDRGKTVIRRVRKNMGDAKDFVNEVADTAEGAFRDARNASS